MGHAAQARHGPEIGHDITFVASIAPLGPDRLQECDVTRVMDAQDGAHAEVRRRDEFKGTRSAQARFDISQHGTNFP